MDSKDAHQAKALRDAFNKVDANGNGFLDSNEVTQVLKDIGVEVSSEELDKFFKEVDTNHDNQISFEELSVWYKTGRGGKAGEVQSKFLSALKQYKREATKKDKEDEDAKKKIDHHHIGVSLGALQEGKTKVEIGSQVGTEAAEKFAELSNGLDIEQPACVILQFASSNPAEAKDGILNFFTGAIEVVSAMGIVPPTVPLDQLKFTATNDDKHVRIGIQMAHEMLAAVSGQVDFFANAFLEGNLTGSLDLKLHLNTSVGDLVDEQDKTFTEHIVKGGSVNVDLRLPKLVIDFARNMLTQNLKSLPPQAQFILEKIAPLLYLRKTNVHLDFDTGDAWAKAIKLPPMGLKELLPQLQGMNIPEMAAMTFPPLADFLEIAEKHLSSDLKIFIRGPQALAHVHLKSEGLGKLWSAMKSN